MPIAYDEDTRSDRAAPAGSTDPLLCLENTPRTHGDDYLLGIEYSMLSSTDAKALKNCRKFVQTERLKDGTGCELSKSAGRLSSERTTTCQPVESLRLHVRLLPPTGSPTYPKLRYGRQSISSTSGAGMWWIRRFSVWFTRANCAGSTMGCATLRGSIA